MFDYDESFIVDQLTDIEDDPPMDCPDCYGQGQLVDFWGPMRCTMCDGTGIVFYAAWIAYVRTFPADIQEHILRQPLHFWTKLNGRSP